MNLDQFLQALCALVSLPEAEQVRAQSVALHLTDQDRLELMRYLKDIDSRLGVGLAQAERFVQEADVLVTTTERRLDARDREASEEAGKTEDIKQAEQNLSSLS
ncbi:MAG: hypothetical protein PHW10_05400 [Candidatus Peribacteraceae bacterium]|nr:hypothetical protein [Candidatus Peribacteraceae bacterium]